MTDFPLQAYLTDASRLVYGCMGLGGDWDDQPPTQRDIQLAHSVVDVALDCGINFFDHADIYAMGKAELVFGQVLKDRPELRERIILQSKCGIRFDDRDGPKRYDLSPEWITQSVDHILRRLGTDYLDLLLLHRPDPLMEPEQMAEVFARLKAEGKVRFFGVSNMQAHQISYLQSFLDEPLVVNQIAISLGQLAWLEEGVLFGSPEGKEVNFTPGTLEYCRQQRMQVQSWGSLAQGQFSGRDISRAAPNIQHAAGLVQALAQKYQTSAEAIVLAWLMRHPARVQPVIGTTQESRLRACARATDVRLSREDWYQLYVAARGKRLP
jgi:predicted oxidoreductase